METSRSGGGRVWSLCSFLVTFLLICVTNADGQIKEVVDPTGNVNLSPFQQWRSAYECLLNTSNSCQDKYQLTEEGWVNVTLADTEEYCKWGGCAQHSRAVLMCLHLVKHDFRFIDKATVQDVNNTITQGCSSGFSGALIASNARKGCESKTILFVSILLALFLLMEYFI